MMLLVVLLMMSICFLLKLNSNHPNTFTSLLQQTLKHNQHASNNCDSVKNMLKPLAFKWLLNELLLETKLTEVMLIWWFVSNKFIKPFLKFSFLICFFNRSLLSFQLHQENCPFSIYIYHLVNYICYIFWYKAFKLRGFPKYIPSKKWKTL